MPDSDLSRRNRVRYCAQHLGELACVLAVDVLAPDAGPRDTWTLEATLDVATVPPSVTRELALAGVDLVPDASGTQGDPPRAIVVATT